MKSLNRVALIGHLGRTPEMKYRADGTAVTTFSLATNRIRQGTDGERHEETDWHPIVAWGALAETCNQFLTKGRLVYVDGQIQTRQWEDAQGQRQTRTEIVAKDVIFLDHAPDEADESDLEEAPEPEPAVRPSEPAPGRRATANPRRR